MRRFVNSTRPRFIYLCCLNWKIMREYEFFHWFEGSKKLYRSTCTNPAAEKWQWSDFSRFPCSLANDNRHFDFNSNFFSFFSPSAKSVVKINANGGIVIDYGRVGREMNFKNPCTSLFWHNTSPYWLIAFPIFCCI